MNEQLAAIKARREAITPGEWTAMEFAQGYGFVTPADNDKLHVIFHTDEICDANAAFIAAAAADIDTLLAMVERLTGERDALNMWCDEWKRRADELAGELAAERDAAKRHAAYIASCVDECGSYRP